MAKSDSRVITDIDFSVQGKQIGHIFIDNPSNSSWFGKTCIPIARIANGSSPSLLLCAGVHGDEYEGQIALRNLVNELDPHDIKGQLVIIPSLNLPAVLAGTRFSPIDNINLNASFPGNAAGSAISMLADWVETTLLPEMDYLIDLHSGGKSSQFLSYTGLQITGDRKMDLAAIDMLDAFDAPRSIVWKGNNQQMLVSAAARQGVPALFGEFGGGGSVSPKGIQIIRKGIDGVMHKIGMRDNLSPSAINATVYLEILGQNHHIFAPKAGLFEPFCQVGDQLNAGASLGQVHPITEITTPNVCKVKEAGILLSLRHLSQVTQGDCLGHTGVVMMQQNIDAIKETFCSD